MIELEVKQHQDSIELLDHEDLVKLLKSMINGGVTLNFYGKRTAMEIAKKVRPRVTRRVNDLHVGTASEPVSYTHLTLPTKA